jgi:DNA invertase Pin-like site-specific DNA recombinase
MAPTRRNLHRQRGARDLRSDLNVVSYARISADTERDGHGVREQHADHDEDAAGRGWSVVKQYTDNYKSASKKGVVRDDFEEMVRVLEVGFLFDGTELHGAIIERFDRASRTFGDWERFHDALISQQGRVLIIDGQDKDPYSDGFLWESAAAMVGAKSEPRKMSARQKASHRRRAMEGRPVGGNRPFGWQDDRLSLHPVEAPLLKKAITDYIAGRSVGAIVRDMWAAGVTSTKGNQWTSAAMKVTLRNPRNCGLRMIDKELVRGRDGKVVIGQWKPICSRAKWEAVVARMDSGPQRIRRLDEGQAQHLLSGFLRCGKATDGVPCLCRLRVTHFKDVKGHSYTCPPRFNGGCAGIGINGMRTDAYITEQVLERLEGRDWGKKAAVAWEGSAQLEDALDRRGALAAAWNSKAISNDLFFPEVEKIEKEIRRLEAVRRRHQASQAKAETLPQNIRQEWAKHASAGDLEWMRSVMFKTLASVIIRPASKGAAPTKLEPARYEIIWQD